MAIKRLVCCNHGITLSRSKTESVFTDLETAKKLRSISGSRKLFAFNVNAAKQHIQYVPTQEGFKIRVLP